MVKNLNGPAVVENVIAGSPAYRAGIKPGDKILSIDGSRMRDAIDFAILMESDVLHDLEVERSGNKTHKQIGIRGEEHGIILESPVFGRLMHCNNDCIFCFVDQLPAGLRKTLYVKDDDYRLSFLEGNFITLTNVNPGDIERIIEDRLSPLYVSLHALNPGLRGRIFGNSEAVKAVETLKSLLSGKIEIHVQIVLLKGLNDGHNLDDTIEGLFELGGGIRSIGIVPVGKTSAGRKKLPEHYTFDRESSVQLIEQVELRKSKSHFSVIYLADEFYYLAGREPPEASYYDDYPQAENGIGLARLFIDGFKDEMTRSGAILNPEGKTIVTSPMGAWVLDRIGVDDYFLQREICGNDLFGESVTVCGLLPGRSIGECIERTYGTGKVIIPGVALNNGLFIDGISLEEIRRGTGRNIYPVNARGSDLLDALSIPEWGES